jgi:hypothetical protein
MKIWDELLRIQIDNKERFQKLFSETVDKIKDNNFDLRIGEIEKEYYFIVVEENRQNSYFVNIVPKQVYNLFKKMQIEAKNDFLGFSVLAGKHKGRDVRVSCFGVPCGILGKSLFKT